MPRLKYYLILIVVFFLATTTVFLIILRLTFKEALLQKEFLPKVESSLAGTLHYGQLDISSFPWPRANFRDVDFQPASVNGHLHAQTVRVTFNPLLVMFGRPVVSRIEIQEGALRYEVTASPQRILMLDHFAFTAGPLRKGGAVRASWNGEVLATGSQVSGSLSLIIPRREAWTWLTTYLTGKAVVEKLPVAEAQRVWSLPFPAHISQGVLAGSIEFTKKQGEGNLQCDAEAHLLDFIYAIERDGHQVVSPPIEIKLEKSQFSWDFDNEFLQVRQAVLETPVAHFEAAARLNYGTGEIQELRISAANMIMENIPQYNLFVKESLPLNFGFSGTSSLEFSMNGTLDHLSLHANWDLTSSLLTYGRFFLKPKDLPTSLIFDFLLKDGGMLSGDFSFRLKEASFKGTVTDLEASSGRGEINVITNKFELAGWQELLPPFHDMTLKGQAKILANFKGYLLDPAEIASMWNITVKDGQFLRGGGRGFRNVSFSLDYGQVELKSTDLRLELGGAEITGSLIAYQWPRNPTYKIRLNSPVMDPSRFVQSLGDALPEFFVKEHSQAFMQSQEFVKSVLPNNEKLEKIQLEAEKQPDSWKIDRLEFDAYGGHALFKGKGGSDSSWLPFSLHVELERISLARYAGMLEGNPSQNAAGGNLFLNMDLGLDDFELQVPWRERLTGKGALSITNGEIRVADLLAEMGRIEELSGLNDLADGVTMFDDFRAPFKLAKGKVMMEKVMLISRDFIVQGGGDMTLQGVLNYRLESFLRRDLASRLQLPLMDISADGESYFGPVPLLLAGPLAKPEFKPDPARLAEMKDNIARRKPSKILRNFLPEDYFFERRAIS